MIYNLEAGLLQAVGMFEHGLSMGLMSAIYNIGSVVLQSSINSVRLRTGYLGGLLRVYFSSVVSVPK